MIIDSHCHLNFDDYQGELDVVIARAVNSGITSMVTIGTKFDEADALIALTQKYSSVHAAVGIHPHEAQATLAQHTRAALRTWLLEKAQIPKVVLIGETGLDYYYEHSPKEQQQQSFETHIEVSQELNIPLTIHTRSAENDTIAILKNMAHSKPVTGIIHCFTGTPFLAKAALDLGLYVSISGIITFNKSQELQEIVKTIPMDRLLVETDAPFLAPIPYRGKRNEPAYILKTVEKIAALKEISVDQVTDATTANFKQLCRKYVI